MPRKKTSLSKRLNKLEKRSRPEVKFRSNQSHFFDPIGSTTGTLLHPQQLNEAVGRNGRIGDKVKSRNIRFQAIMRMPATPSNGSCAIRVLVLRSKIQNPTTSDMPTWFQPADEDKFFVVKDVLTQVSSLTASGTNLYGSTVKQVKFNIPVGLRKMQYDGGSLQSPVNNEYIIYMLAENTDGEVAYNWRHYYIDN